MSQFPYNSQFGNVKISSENHDAELEEIDFGGQEDDDDDLIEVKPESLMANSHIISTNNVVKYEEEPTGIIGTDQVQHPAWLLKVPKYFAEEFQAAFETGGVELGKIVEHDVPKGAKRKLIFSVTDAEWTKRLPREYTLNLTQTGPRGLYAFTKDSDTKAATALVGQVVMEAITVPIRDERLAAIKKERRARDIEPKKRMEVVTLREARDAEALGHHGSITRDALKQQVSVKKTKLDRAEAMPKSELRTELFAAFSEHEYWNFLGLEKRTRQPATWLRESLSEIARPIQRGPNHGMWVLKPEYRVSRDGEQSGGGQE